MKSIPPESAWLADIAGACARLGAYLRGVDRAAFLANSEKCYAVFAQLIIIGEAAARFAPEFRHRHAALPWKQMIGMRNRMVHGYDAIDWNIVWDTATAHIPPLLAALQPLLPPAGAEPAPEGGEHEM